jgi:hypothetical protein
MTHQQTTAIVSYRKSPECVEGASSVLQFISWHPWFSLYASGVNILLISLVITIMVMQTGK